MYALPAFRWDDRLAALGFAAEFNFATLITVEGGGPVMSHLPMLVDAGRGVLCGHLARANSHASILDGRRHVAIFMGPFAYVTPDWYGAGSTDVPTWNYVAVHIAGGGRVVADAGGVDRFLADLSACEEMRRTDLDRGGKMWTMDKVPPAKHAAMRAAIVAFEIDIVTVDAKAKLSQNKPADAARRVAAELASSGGERGRALAALMEAAAMAQD